MTVTKDTIRKAVGDAAEMPGDLENATLRDAVNMLKGYEPLLASELTSAEVDYADANFTFLMEAIAAREGIDENILGYIVTETAMREMTEEAITDETETDAE